MRGHRLGSAGSYQIAAAPTTGPTRRNRATLPGGNLGEYAIEGFTETMLRIFEIPLEQFTEAVRTAAMDDDVAAFALDVSEEDDRYLFAR